MWMNVLIKFHLNVLTLIILHYCRLCCIVTVLLNLLIGKIFVVLLVLSHFFHNAHEHPLDALELTCEFW